MTADDDDDDNRGGGRGGRGGGGGDAAVAAASAFKIRQMPVRQLSATDPLVVCGGTGWRTGIAEASGYDAGSSWVSRGGGGDSGAATYGTGRAGTGGARINATSCGALGGGGGGGGCEVGVSTLEAGRDTGFGAKGSVIGGGGGGITKPSGWPSNEALTKASTTSLNCTLPCSSLSSRSPCT